MASPSPASAHPSAPESGMGLGFTGVEGITGLTAAEVAEREAAGLVNVQSRDTSRSLGQILRVHVFTLFNLAIALCAVVVILMGRWLDLLFSLAAVANVVIGVVQEYSAKRKLDRIALLHQDDVLVIRDGARVPLPMAQIVRDDVVVSPGSVISSRPPVSRAARRDAACTSSTAGPGPRCTWVDPP